MRKGTASILYKIKNLVVISKLFLVNIKSNYYYFFCCIKPFKFSEEWQLILVKKEARVMKYSHKASSIFFYQPGVPRQICVVLKRSLTSPKRVWWAGWFEASANNAVPLFSWLLVKLFWTKFQFVFWRNTLGLHTNEFY